MSIETNKQAVRNLYEDVLSQGNLALIDQLVSPEMRNHNGLDGQEGFKQTVMMLRIAFPDIHYHVDDIIAENDKVVVRWTFHGTHLGPFEGREPTGRQVTNRAIAIFRLQESQVVERWALVEGVAHQLEASR
jgi:predicted ester cyclase